MRLVVHLRCRAAVQMKHLHNFDLELTLSPSQQAAEEDAGKGREGVGGGVFYRKVE